MGEDDDTGSDGRLSWRLPPEILALVFKQLQRLWADATGRRGGLGMIEVSQVSRFWRAVCYVYLVPWDCDSYNSHRQGRAER